MTALARRWAGRPWLWALALVVVAGSALVALRYAPIFSVEQVTVVGSEQVSVDQVLAAAQVPVGQPLVSLPSGAIEQRVETLDAVASAEVTRVWPDGVRISVQERRAVGYLPVAGGAELVGSDARVYRSQRQLPSDLPALTGLTSGSNATVSTEADPTGAALLAVAGSLPRRLQRDVAQIEADGPRQVRLILDDGVVVMWGAAGAAEQKASVVLMLQRRPGWGSLFAHVDVSAPEAPALAP